MCGLGSPCGVLAHRVRVWPWRANLSRSPLLSVRKTEEDAAAQGGPPGWTVLRAERLPGPRHKPLSFRRVLRGGLQIQGVCGGSRDVASCAVSPERFERPGHSGIGVLTWSGLSSRPAAHPLGIFQLKAASGASPVFNQSRGECAERGCPRGPLPSRGCPFSARTHGSGPLRSHTWLWLLPSLCCRGLRGKRGNQRLTRLCERAPWTHPDTLGEHSPTPPGSRCWDRDDLAPTSRFRMRAGKEQAGQ